jgi:GxxExxY protein
MYGGSQASRQGLFEIVYKDALEHEFNLNNINYSREKEYPVTYKGVILPHKFYADFIIEEK